MPIRREDALDGTPIRLTKRLISFWGRDFEIGTPGVIERYREVEADYPLSLTKEPIVTITLFVNGIPVPGVTTSPDAVEVRDS